ncbi:aspartate aminotransferase family protein [Micromonospora orduensis]|uniref:Aspartate aminotransferase family protein n=1 Tax=Micromonospora orduensis TaxID=1420891 RepID=A0A5C4QS17_9ACTN|nr:aspartate aminotransferase family protein [Micromonospora orduensis]TNH28007.1 aspartate aminotransferase family protein [Micromonospora orduensis]
MTISQATPALSTSPDELEDLDRRHLIHPLLSGGSTDRCVIVRGKGSTVWDARGNELLDMTGAGNWLAQVGHGRVELGEVMAEQVGRLSYFTSFSEFSNDQSIQLAKRLSTLAPEGFNRVLYTSGGSEAVDMAIKAVRLYHSRRGEPDRTWIISRQMGYHGSTYGGGSATGFDFVHHGVGPTLPHVRKVSPPFPFHPEMYGGEPITDFLVRELEQTIEEIGPGRVAAMIGEPVMGGGGVVEPPPDYWPRVREVLSRHGILLIADEVVTGYGRTGSWFASPERGMAPDVITTAKGITSGYAPLGAALMRDEIGDVVGGGDGFLHGFTYCGHPVGCAVALANLDIIEKEGLVPRSLLIGKWLRQGLAPAAELPAVGEVRVTGATVGIELVANRTTREPMPPPVASSVVKELQQAHGVIARAYGPVVVMAPPLVLEEGEAARAAEATVEVLSRLGTDGTLNS